MYKVIVTDLENQKELWTCIVTETDKFQEFIDVLQAKCLLVDSNYRVDVENAIEYDTIKLAHTIDVLYKDIKAICESRINNTIIELEDK